MLTPTPTAFQIPHLVSFFLSPFARSISSIQLTHCFCHRYLNKRRLNGESATSVGPKRSGETVGSNGTPAKRRRGRPKGSKKGTFYGSRHRAKRARGKWVVFFRRVGRYWRRGGGRERRVLGVTASPRHGGTGDYDSAGRATPTTVATTQQQQQGAVDNGSRVAGA